jgi:hypothetical protein
MADLLQRASDWLEAMRTKHASRSVTYQRDDAAAVVSATIGKTVFTIEEGGGIATQYVSRDFLIMGAELVLAGQAVLPQRGDRIRELQGEQTFVYEVLAPGKEPCFRYSDPYRKTFRIHTKQVF